MNDLELYKSFAYNKLTFRYEKYNSANNSFPPLACNFFGKMLEGEGHLSTADGETLHLVAGDFFFLPRGTRYHSHWFPSSSGNQIVQWQAVRFDYIPSRSERHYRMQKLPPIPSLVDFFHRLEQKQVFDLESVGRLYLCFNELENRLSKVQSDPRRILYEKAEKYMREHQNFKVPELAKFCAMSESGLYAFFASYAGTTPIEMKNRICIEKAQLLLESTNLSIEEVSTQIGFKSVSYFRKLFSSYTGKKPTIYRKDIFQNKLI